MMECMTQRRAWTSRQHKTTEMAHYANDCWDAEVLTSYGWIEVRRVTQQHRICRTAYLQDTKPCVSWDTHRGLPVPLSVVSPAKAAPGGVSVAGFGSSLRRSSAFMSRLFRFLVVSRPRFPLAVDFGCLAGMLHGQLVGHADRACFDLKMHSEATGTPLVAFEEFNPPIVQPGLVASLNKWVLFQRFTSKHTDSNRT